MIQMIFQGAITDIDISTTIRNREMLSEQCDTSFDVTFCEDDNSSMGLKMLRLVSPYAAEKKLADFRLKVSKLVKLSGAGAFFSKRNFRGVDKVF